MEATGNASVRESPDVVTQVVYQLWLRSDEANVVGKEKEDGGESGRAKAVRVGVDVFLQDGDVLHRDGDAVHNSVEGARVTSQGGIRWVVQVLHRCTVQAEEGKRVGWVGVGRPFRG
jgi:hypothetical protein